MKQKAEWSPGPDVQVLDVERVEAHWIVHTLAVGPGCCPVCSTPSKCRYGWNARWLQDLPAQGTAVKVSFKQARWRCGNVDCKRMTFVDPMPRVAPPFSRRTQRVGDLAVLLAHATGGRPAERLMKRLGLIQSDDTLLRSLKRRAASGHEPPVRVVGVDDWSWRKGSTYGTILVDLEHRQVLDVLADRSASTTASWLERHPEVEIVSRDRCGLYAQGAVQGAPQAQQVADRFHLLQNLRQGIEKQMMRASHQNASTAVTVAAPDLLPPPAVVFERYGRPEVMEHRHQLQVARIASSQRSFKTVKALHGEGKSFTTIAHETGLNWRTVAKWAGLDVAPVRRTMAAKTTTPETFRAHLARRWSDGCTMGRMLLAEIKLLGYTGSFTHLQRLLCKWRQAHFAAMAGAPAQQAAITLENRLPPEVAPIAAAALCIKPRGLLTEPQAAVVDALKLRSPDFAKMRQLAMRFRGILRGGQADRLDAWLHDALESRIHCMRRFAITLQHDIAAVRNAISEPWSNGQTEGQINRLKTLKRAMYGRAGVELIRARLLLLPSDCANAN